tara:strand:- start:122 stop:349 length:228 start_codon:yes stop_codon:yes gene_type:complete
MIKIFLLLMVFSSPNQPSVKYTAALYFNELECIIAKENYIKIYRNQSQQYKDKVKTEAFCIPFDSFPLTKKKTGA